MLYCLISEIRAIQPLLWTLYFLSFAVIACFELSRINWTDLTMDI